MNTEHKPIMTLREIMESEHPADNLNGFKFEHILISVTIAHNREIGQFDDSCAHQLQKVMMEYQGVLMVDAQTQYKHCSEEQHTNGCACGLCEQVRRLPMPE